MPTWIAIVPAAVGAAEDPDLAAKRAAENMPLPLDVTAIYVMEATATRIYEVGVYQVPR